MTSLMTRRKTKTRAARNYPTWRDGLMTGVIIGMAAGMIMGFVMCNGGNW